MIILFIFVAIVAIPTLLFMDQHLRVVCAFMHYVARRTSICEPIRTGLLASATTADWDVRADTRIEASNKLLNSSAWGYDFSAEAHLFVDGTQIKLAKWEQFILNRALRKRAKAMVKDRTATHIAANDARTVELAERIIQTYVEPLGEVVR